MMKGPNGFLDFQRDGWRTQRGALAPGNEAEERRMTGKLALMRKRRAYRSGKMAYRQGTMAYRQETMAYRQGMMAYRRGVMAYRQVKSLQLGGTDGSTSGRGDPASACSRRQRRGLWPCESGKVLTRRKGVDFEAGDDGRECELLGVGPTSSGNARCYGEVDEIILE